MANLMDFMTPEEREVIKQRLKDRTERKAKYESRVSPEIYILAEFGYYYGWQAVRAAIDNEITFEDMFCLLEAAKKVWYGKVIDNARASRVACASAFSSPKDSARHFEDGMKPFRDRMKLEE